MIDLGSTTRIEGPNEAPVAHIIKFFHRITGRGQEHQADFQKIYDDGIQIALRGK